MINLEFIKRHAFFLLGGACIIIVGIIYIATRSDGAYAEFSCECDVNFIYVSAEDTPAYIRVHIDGAVNNRGVFSLPAGARVEDALALAGGETIDANLAGINLAAFLRDAQQIIIPSIHDDFGAAQGGITRDGLVNINRANLTELQTLQGVGAVRAQAIIDFRETYGNFASVEELINISGIGEATMNNLRERVTVE
jgi:competence protein ComEA